jgi:KUP system potassium uptake protein
VDSIRRAWFVVLTVTGVETLYADMGHFGRTAIRLGWLLITLPGLILNYLGQVRCCCAIRKRWPVPSMHWHPNGFHYPLVALATVATIIASQAVISGVFSITRQSFSSGSCRAWKSATPRQPITVRFSCRAPIRCC